MDGFQLTTGQIVSLKAYRVNAIIFLGSGLGESPCIDSNIPSKLIASIPCPTRQ